MRSWLVALALALSGSPAPAPAPPAGAPRPAADAVLITIDTLRADALGFAGNAKVRTPALDRLAAGGRVFPSAHAHNVVTLPSHANILTGLYPFQHGVRDNSGFRLPETIPTLATVLRGCGFATAAFVGAFPLDSEFGLDRGFDVYDDRYPKGSRPAEFVMPARPGNEVVTPALTWWREQAGRRRFLWVHLYEPHAPYAAPARFAARHPADPYLAEVEAVDALLAPLLAPFLAGAEQAVIAFTADHGEALGDHGEATHGLFAYEATLRVPLLFWGAGVAPGRDERPSGHVDLFPTLLAALGVEEPRAPSARLRRPGHSLLAAPPARPPDFYFEALSTTLNRGWAPLRGLLAGGRKWIDLPEREVYDLAVDPGEARNLHAAERAAAEVVLARLPSESVWPPQRETVAGESERAPGDESERALREESERALRALGYLGSAAPIPAAYGPEDDPKRLVALDDRIHRIIDLYSLGRPEEAVALARTVASERPQMPLGHSLLAQALLETGATQEALAVMLAARDSGRLTSALARQLGLTLAEAGRGPEAVAVLAPLAANGDVAARTALAVAYLRAGKPAEARATLEAVLAEDADEAKALEEMALIELESGRAGAARDWARRALAVNDALPLAWNYLGVALFQLGDPAAAVEAWRRAVELDARLWDALWNLGTKSAELGLRDQAMSALRRFVATAPPATHAEDIERARQLLRRLSG